jgi:folate-binding protein YgfZ
MLSPDPMAYKTSASPEPMPPGPLPALSGFGVLAADGPQAAAFLQAQLMNDVAALAVGQWQWNGWLTAKGRVVALFALLRTGDAAFRLVLPDVTAEELRTALGRYVFRSKVTLRVADEVACAAEFDVRADADVPRDVARSSGDGWSLDWSGASSSRRLWLLPADACAAPDPDDDATWRTADLWHGLPRLSIAQREAWTPQMLSLQRLRAFSVKKGCYPGQEIVARTHFLGQAKRGLALIAGQGLEDGAHVATADGSVQGTVVSVAAGGGLALAVVNAQNADASWFCGGLAVERLPLKDGLQRPA